MIYIFDKIKTETWDSLYEKQKDIFDTIAEANRTICKIYNFELGRDNADNMLASNLRVI